MNRVIQLFLALFLISACQTNEEKTVVQEHVDVFEQVWQHIDEHFYDQNFNGADWANLHDEYLTEVEKCTSSDALFSVLNKMLSELNSSHCGVGLLSEMDNVVSPYIFKNGEIGIDIRILEDQIVVTRVDENSPADKAGIKTGFVIEKIDGLTINAIEKKTHYAAPFNERNRTFHLTSEVLRHIYGQFGTTVQIDFLDEQMQAHSEILKRKERRGGIPLAQGMPPAYLESTGFFISDDIGYLSFNAFNPADLEHVLSNLENLSTTKGLIIDLRGNDGGSIDGMKRLLGRFVPDRRKYGTYINRYEQNEDFIEPMGERYTGVLVVLVDEMSISGAENMPGIVQQFDLGKVIGNRTPGQMLWGNGYPINDSVAMVIPIYTFEYPDGYVVEGNGIQPDIEIELKQEDLLKGKDTQLEKAIDYLEGVLRN